MSNDMSPLKHAILVHVPACLCALQQGLLQGLCDWFLASSDRLFINCFFNNHFYFRECTLTFLKCYYEFGLVILYFHFSHFRNSLNLTVIFNGLFGSATFPGTILFWVGCGFDSL